jgi:hypothetical protein
MAGQTQAKGLVEMPGETAALFVTQYLRWGCTHKPGPEYTEFVSEFITPVLTAEKIRLFFKNLHATYHEKFLLARKSEWHAMRQASRA